MYAPLCHPEQDSEKGPPAAFSYRSEAQRTVRVRFASSLAAALLDSLFAHPAWRFSMVSNLDIRDGYRGQNEFFRSLLEPVRH